MSEFASKQKQKAGGQDQGKKTAASSNERREGRHFGDACVHARIVLMQIADHPDFHKPRVKLGLAVPSGADVANDAEAQVEGVPAGTLRIKHSTDKYAVAYSDEELTLDMLKGHTQVVIACTRSTPRATEPVKARVINRHLEDGQTVISMSAGKLQGVAVGMHGTVVGQPNVGFQIKDIKNQVCFAILNGVADAKEVVITP